MKLKKGIKETDIVVRSGADMVLPFALIFGLYVILFGTVSPGGGFQGGVMVASACLLLYLGYGYKATTNVLNRELLEVSEAIGAIIYVLLAACGLFMGARFCQNVFYDIGNVGDLISAGTVTFMSFTVGYKVLTGVGFLLLLMLYLLGDDEDEEVDEK